MTTFEHEPDCDRAHTLRQPCNTRGRREQSDEVRTEAAVVEPPADTRGTAPSPAPQQTDPASVDERHQRRQPTDSERAPQPADATREGVATSLPSHAIADGPLEPIDTGGLPTVQLIGVAVAFVAVLVGAARLLRRRQPRD
jgi:hypothetical protein